MTPPADTGRVLDLDAKRAARYEEAGPPPVLVLDGRRFELPRSIPLEILDAFTFDGDRVDLSPGDVLPLLDGLLGPVLSAEVRAIQPPFTLDDLSDLVPGLLELYGLTLGESQASPDSSADISPPSRPTSPASTASTSPAHSGGNRADRRRRSRSGASATSS